MFYLKIKNSAKPLIPIGEKPLIIGRSPECDIVLPHLSVSRKHAYIKKDGSKLYIRDLGSTNGVIVNGEKLHKQTTTIEDGDHIKIGIFEIEVEGYPTKTEIKLDFIENATVIKPIQSFVEQLDQQRVQQEAKISTNWLLAINDLAKYLLKAEKVSDICMQSLKTAKKVLNFERGFVLLQDQETSRLKCIAAIINNKEMLYPPKKDIPISYSILQQVMQKKVALLTADAQKDHRFQVKESIMIHSIRSALCVPLYSDINIIGVIQVDSTFKNRIFTEEDLEFLTSIANYMAIAIEKLQVSSQLETEKMLINSLRRYHSPQILDTILKTLDKTSKNFQTLSTYHVTVMFADLVGFTPLTESLPPYEIASLLQIFFDCSVDIIFAHGGTLDKFIGDCCMAFFGAPIKHKDHAVRAIRAAIDIQKKISLINETLKKENSPPLKVRIALNSGTALVGDIGSKERVDYSVIGNTVNIAARIESSAAKPDSICIGESTAQLIPHDLFKPHSLGRFTFKGISEPLEVFEIPWQNL